MKVGYQILADLQQQQAFKQWGFTVFDPVYYKNVNFTLPLSVNGTFCAFSTGYDAKVSTFLWHSMSHFNNVNVGVTGFVFDSRYTFTGLGYLAICWQKQWGNSWSGYTGVFNWYFPISPSQVYAACLTKHTKNISSSHNWEPARVEEWNNSYARIHPDGDLGYSVIAICKAQQQWGINTGGAVRTSTLPIPFTNVFLAVASTSSEWCCPGCSATNTTVTTRAYQSNRPDVAQPNDVNWIIIGCQPQWGYCSSRTATFPIPFPTAALFIVAVPKTTSTSATATGAEYLGTTSVNLYLHGTSGWYFVGGH